MNTEQRISIITLGVADLDRSRSFYERLGWRPSKASSEGIAFFQAGGMALALYPRSELAKDAKLPPMARDSAESRSPTTAAAEKKLMRFPPRP